MENTCSAGGEREREARKRGPPHTTMCTKGLHVVDLDSRPRNKKKTTTEEEKKLCCHILTCNQFYKQHLPVTSRLRVLALAARLVVLARLIAGKVRLPVYQKFEERNEIFTAF